MNDTRLKFRYWDNWEMKYDLPITQWYTLNEHLNDSDYIIMQSTGLKDSKWIEIYEGDILSDKWIVAGVVTFWKYKRAKYFKRENPVNHLWWHIKQGINVESLENAFYSLVEDYKITNNKNYIEIIWNIHTDNT